MTALVLDAGPLVKIDRDDRRMLARLKAAQRNGLELRTHPFVVAQVWRDPGGRQANLARLLAAIDVVPVDEAFGRACGALLGRAQLSDPIDAGVVLIAQPGDRIVTGDPDDMRRLADAAHPSIILLPA